MNLGRQDVIVVGAGIIGISSAYYLKKNNPKKKVLVIDRNVDAGCGNTSKAAGMFRHIFASTHNAKLSFASISFYKHLQKTGHEIGLKEIGYLWLLSERQYSKLEVAIHAMRHRGIEMKFANELVEIPGLRLNPDHKDPEVNLLKLPNIHAGLYCQGCGELDQTQLVTYYKKEFLRLGGKILFQTNVKSLQISPPPDFGIPLIWQNAKIDGVRTDKGELKADKIVLATGAYSKTLLDPLGIADFSRPKKRQLFQVKCPQLESLTELPFTVLPRAGVFLKPEKSAKAFTVGGADDLGRPFDVDDHPNRTYYEYNIHPILIKYFPAFEKARVINAQAGSYYINYLDKTPFVFEKHSMIIVSGCSGSGIMKADAIGRIVDALYRGEHHATLHGDSEFTVDDIGVESRSAEKESFVL